MMFRHRISRVLGIALLMSAFGPTFAQTLPSWQDGAAKTAIVDFVTRVSQKNSRDFVAVEDRIAVFDNDGTLCPEQPMYFQFAFALENIKVLAPQHPEWHNTQPFKAAIEGDAKTVAASGEKGLLELLAVSHAGMTTDAYAGSVNAWLQNARHPQFKRRYTQLAYQPMLELLDYLRANGFKTFIVSAGGVEFIRVFAERVYRIPPEQVIGSSGATKFVIDAKGQPLLVKEPKVEFFDDGPSKPSGIHRVIGRRPIFAFGNSDGDLQMLQWTAGGLGLRFVGIVHHTDDKREYAYDRESRIGRLDKALDEAQKRSWTIVDMKSDWRTVFRPEQ